MRSLIGGPYMAIEDDVRAKIPQFHQLMFPALKALKALGGSGTNEEILDKVSELEKIPDEVQRVPHLKSDQGTTELGYRLAWAKTYLKGVGAVDNSERGIWTVTEKGRNFTEDDCRGIRAEVRELRKLRRKKGPQAPKGNDNADEEEDRASSWQDMLLPILLKMKPDAFERLGQRILREAGFTKVEVTGKSGDGGIDGIGILRVNLVSFTVLFQCKRYQGSVGASVIRDFRGAMQGRCDKGLVITTGNSAQMLGRRLPEMALQRLI